VEIIGHEESAAQQVLAKRLGLLAGEAHSPTWTA